VVEPVKLPEKSKGGIILRTTGSMQEKLDSAGRMIGVILATGPQCWKAHAAALDHILTDRDPAREPWAVVGDTILYSRHAGKFTFDPMDDEADKRELYLIHDDDVLAKLPPQSEWSLDYNDITV
jgi:co-chaperonin GroES (HSP10)